jgi:hypothetical protein
VAKELTYRTFDELLASVAIDFSVYNNEGMIEPAQLIKVAMRVNQELGIRLHRTKEAIIEIDNGKAKLPADLYTLNRAFLCSKWKVIEQAPSGTHKEDVILDGNTCTKCGEPDPTCSCEKTYSVCNNTHVKVVEKKKFITREYEDFCKLYISPSSYSSKENTCGPHETKYHAEIKHGFLYITGVNFGKIFISYESNMEDEEGNLLVIDHPEINEYYEFSMKERILYNLYMNGEDTERKWKLTQEEMRKARNNAYTIVNTPNFREMQETWMINRRAMYHKYYNQFR